MKQLNNYKKLKAAASAVVEIMCRDCKSNNCDVLEECKAIGKLRKVIGYEEEFEENILYYVPYLPFGH